MAADVRGKDEVETECRISSINIYKSCSDYWNAAVYNRSILTVYGCTFYKGCFIKITFSTFLIISSSNNVVVFNGSPITVFALSWKPKNYENSHILVSELYIVSGAHVKQVVAVSQVLHLLSHLLHSSRSSLRFLSLAITG